MCVCNPAFRKLGLETCKFKASLGYPVSKKKNGFCLCPMHAKKYV